MDVTMPLAQLAEMQAAQDKRIVALEAQLTEAREAIRDVFTLFDDGLLVRNIAEDGDYVHFAKTSMRVVAKLARLRKVIE